MASNKPLPLFKGDVCMIKLCGNFMDYEQDTKAGTNEIRTYVKVLDEENSAIRRVKVKDVKPFLELEKSALIEMSVKISQFNGNLYFQGV